MDGLKVPDRGSTPKVEEILPDADVSCGVPLPGGDVSEGVFDLHTLTELPAASCGLLQAAKLLLQAFIVGDRDRASAT